MVMGSVKRLVVPEFSSYEEEAAFWDQIDLGEYEDELEEVELEVGHPIGHVLAVRLESEEFRRLAALARARGANLVELAQSWVVEALDRETASVADAGDAIRHG